MRYYYTHYARMMSSVRYAYTERLRHEISKRSILYVKWGHCASCASVFGQTENIANQMLTGTQTAKKKQNNPKNHFYVYENVGQHPFIT